MSNIWNYYGINLFWKKIPKIRVINPCVRWYMNYLQTAWVPLALYKFHINISAKKSWLVVIVFQSPSNTYLSGKSVSTNPTWWLLVLVYQWVKFAGNFIWKNMSVLCMRKDECVKYKKPTPLSFNPTFRHITITWNKAIQFSVLG